MENLTPGFHIEYPMINSDKDAVSKLLSLKEIGSYKIVNSRSLAYIDTYWDTVNGDLYNSSRVLRTRKRDEEFEFIDYKGTPQYLFQVLFARKLFSERVRGTQEALDAISLTKPSGPIQALYRDRIDLLGNVLVQVANCHVERTNFDLVTSANEGFCTISVHKFYFDTKEGETDLKELIEVQPYSKSLFIIEKLPEIFLIVTEELKKLKWKLSPASKYHRLDRKYIEQIGC